MLKRFVILDRDGTLIVERHYLRDAAGVELLPGAAEGLRRFRDLGWCCLVVTNQSAIGRGILDLETSSAIQERMATLLAARGSQVDGVYLCPHTPDDDCPCRKPRTGLVLQAAKEWGFDARDCVVIGDKASDIEMGRAVGAVTILVRTGYGEEHLRNGWAKPDFVVDSVEEAAGVVARIFDPKPASG